MEVYSLSEFEVNLVCDCGIGDLYLKELDVTQSVENILTTNFTQFMTKLLQRISFDGNSFSYKNTESTKNRNEELLTIAVILLNFYLGENYTGPPAEQLPSEIILRLTQLQEMKHFELIIDGEEMVDNLKFPILILIAEKLLEQVDKKICPTVAWWKLRVYFLHQRFLEEKSQICRECILNAKNEFEAINNSYTICSQIIAVFYCEVSTVHAYYYDIEGAKEYLGKAKEMVGIKAFPTGVLGKRTKFQQTDLAQLVLKVETISEVDDDGNKIINRILPSTNKIFPQAVYLEDEVRLEKISLNDESFQGTLTAHNINETQHLVLLTEFQLKQIYLPADEIYIEELLAYLSFLIDCPKVWGVHMVALLNRSILEKTHRRTVERSMKQLQTLSRAVESQNPALSERQRYLYATNMPMLWEVEISLSKVLFSLNLYKEALDISLRLKRWEDVIQCYTDLNLRHKAEEVIREQLKQNNTVKLWTLLGDATDNTEYYEKAWILSGQKSARAKRQWGFHHFHKKQYKEAIGHLEESLKLNPLENPAWLRLGYAALEIENWEISSKAFQHSTTLDADNFEAWNNLANAFVKLGHKNKALRALREATKCNFDNWKVWENTLIVATDCRAYDEVIRAYNRLFDLRGKWIDDEVLALLTRAIVTDKLDSTDNPSRHRYLPSTLKLFGRITASVTNNPKIWKLYADLLLAKVKEDELVDIASADSLEMTWHKSVSYSQRAVQAILADPNWSKADQGLHEAVDLSSEYIKSVHNFIEKFPSSPRGSEAIVTMQFTIKRIYNAIKKISEAATQPEIFEKYLGDLKKNAALIEGTSLQ